MRILKKGWIISRSSKAKTREKFFCVISDTVKLYRSDVAFKTGEPAWYLTPRGHSIHTGVWIHPVFSEQVGIELVLAADADDALAVAECREHVPDTLLEGAVPSECVFCNRKHFVARLQIHSTDVLFDGIHEILHWAVALQQMSGDGVSWEMPPTFLGELATVTGLRMAPLTSFDAVARALNLPPIQALHVTGNEDLPPVTSGLGPMKALTPEQLTWYMRDLASFLGIISSNRSILDEIEAKDGEYVQQLAMLAELPAEERAGALAACIPDVGKLIRTVRYVQRVGAKSAAVQELKIQHLSLYNNISLLTTVPESSSAEVFPAPDLNTLIGNVNGVLEATRRVVRSQMRMQADLDAMLRAVLRLKMASNNQYTEADFAALLGAVPTMPARSPGVQRGKKEERSSSLQIPETTTKDEYGGLTRAFGDMQLRRAQTSPSLKMGELDEEAPCNMRLSAEHDMPWLTSSRSAGEGPVLVTGDCGCVGARDACRYEHYSIIFNTDAKKTVKAATADSLMRYITSPDYPNYGGAFAMALCVYKMFWTFEDLLRFLWQRFSTQAPREWPEDEREKYRRQFIEPVQERVIKMVSLMIGRHYIDYYDNVKHIAQIINLCLAMAPTHSQAAERLLFMLYVKTHTAVEEPYRQTFAAPRDMDEVAERMNFWNIDDARVAEQITLIDWRLFAAIRASELLGQAWNRPGAKTKSPNVLNMIERSNQVTAFVVKRALSLIECKRRANFLSKMITIAYGCYQLNNYASAKALLAGIRHSAVARLKHTFHHIPRAKKAEMKELETVFSADNNCSRYRQTLAAASGPCIPFLGTLLTDLTMVDSGNPDYIDSHPSYINVNKLRMTYSLLDTIVLRRQMKPYNLSPIKHLITILTTPVEQIDEEAVFAKSLALEPRGATYDQIA